LFSLFYSPWAKRGVRKKDFLRPFAQPYGSYRGLIFRTDNADHSHLHLSSHTPGLLPTRKPLGQIAGIAQTAETAIHGVLIAPTPGPVAIGHARLDAITVKPPADRSNSGQTMGRDGSSASAAMSWSISRSCSGGSEASPSRSQSHSPAVSRGTSASRRSQGGIANRDCRHG